MNKRPFDITYLDHVAIEVADLDTSAKWYEKWLGLTHHKVAKWGDYPRFLLAGDTGLALFPKNTAGHKARHGMRTVDHIAFRVPYSALHEAKAYLESGGMQVAFSDHHYFHSIYFTDPDGHRLELTAAVPNHPFKNHQCN